MTEPERSVDALVEIIADMLAGKAGARDRARAALRARPAQGDDAPQAGERETQWEVWEGDMMVAGSTSEADARHYLAVYSQDGPVSLMRADTVRVTIVPALRTDGRTSA